MDSTVCSETIETFISEVRRIIGDRVQRLAPELGDSDLAQLLPGKMLRSRLAGRLIAGGVGAADRPDVVRLCAAVELVHTASLCHDDVIDTAELRRGRAALWQAVGVPGAVLIGDRLLCEALDLLVGTNRGRYLPGFVPKLTEALAAEARQELLLRGESLDEATCLRVARGKTGPLFALAALACGGQDRELSDGLQEAGYQFGTAYQLADDLLDRVGDEAQAGKTLGTDLRRRKFTLAADLTADAGPLRRRVQELCDSALQCLAAWPAARAAARAFLENDLQPIFARLLGPAMEGRGSPTR